jgi:hypothetical protein
MPGPILAPVSVGVFPQSLSVKFTASRKYETRLLEYHDGTTERGTLVNAPRRTWKASKRLTPAEASTLRSWFDAHQADAFYFYDLRETTPPNTWDPTGTATAGRYIVRFASDWQETIDMARSDVGVELIELGGGGTGAILQPNATGSLPITGTITVWSEFVKGISAGPEVSIGISGEMITSFLLPYGVGFQIKDSNGSYGLTSDSLVIDPATWNGGVSFFMYPNGLPSGGFQTYTPAPELRIYDSYLDVTYADATTARLKPRVTSVLPAVIGGAVITNAGLAIDGDSNPPATFASYKRSFFNGNSYGNSMSQVFQLSVWL